MYYLKILYSKIEKHILAGIQQTSTYLSSHNYYINFSVNWNPIWVSIAIYKEPHSFCLFKLNQGRIQEFLKGGGVRVVEKAGL